MPDGTGHERRGRGGPGHRGPSVDNWLAQEALLTLTDRFAGGERMQEAKAAADAEENRGSGRGGIRAS